MPGTVTPPVTSGIEDATAGGRLQSITSLEWPDATSVASRRSASREATESAPRSYAMCEPRADAGSPRSPSSSGMTEDA